MTVIPRSIVRTRALNRSAALARVALAALAFAALLGVAACSQATDPARRFAVLDDAGQNDWQTVTVGADHSCALKTNGDAYCWGSNQFGQLGVASTDTVCGSNAPLTP